LTRAAASAIAHKVEHEIRSILIYTDGEVMGDGVLRLPYVAALKKHFPSAHITRLTSDRSVYDSALRSLAAPYFDAALHIDPAMPWRDFLWRPAALRGQRFDLIIDTQRKFKRSLWLKRIAHRRFASASARFIFSDKKPAKTATASPRVLDQLVALTEAAIGAPLPLAPLALPSPLWAEAARLALPDGPNYVGLVVGAGHPSKCWPLERFIALAEQLSAQNYVPVFFLGPQEHDKLAPIRAALPHALVPLSMPSMVDRADPCFTIALAGRLRAAVGNDSGGGHLLAAGGCPIVSLFRADTVRKKFMPNHAVGLAPEDFLGTRNVMADIPAAAVEKALLDLLNRSIN